MIRKIISKDISTEKPDLNSFGYIAAGLGILLILSKISALIKTQVLIAIYGIQSAELDIFHTANVIPEFLVSTITLGGINAALIPIFSELHNKNDSKITIVFSSIINIFFILLFSISILLFIFAPIIPLIIEKIDLTNAYNELSIEEMHLFVSMFRILIFSSIVLSISAIFSSMLQVKKAFWITGLAPLFYNIGIILSAFLSVFINQNPLIIAYGVLFGSILHFLIQLPSIVVKNINYNPNLFEWQNKYVKQSIKNTFQRSIGLAGEYIAMIVQSFIALNAVTGTLNAFKLALSIRDIPYHLIGLPLAQSSFVEISKYAKESEKSGLQEIFSKTIRLILLWSIPFVSILLVLRTPISQLLFGLFIKDGNFQGTNMVSYAVLFLSLSILFISIIGVVNRVFYALGDTKTPTIVSLFIVTLEISLTYGLVNLFSHFDDSMNLNPLFIIFNYKNYFSNNNSPAAIGGIALATTLSSFINLIILSYFLKLKNIFILYQKKYILPKIISGLFSTVSGFTFFKITNDFFDTTKVAGILLITINSAFIIILTYYLLEKIQKDKDIQIIEESLYKIKTNLVNIIKLINKRKVLGVGS